MSIKTILQKVTVEPVLFFYMFCTFMSLPLLQQLAYRKICDQEFSETCANLTKAQQNKIQSKTSEWIRYQSIASTVPSVFSSLVLGSWSDSVGRKSIMILPQIGNVLMSINHLLNIHFFEINVDYLLIGVIISGSFGGFATTLSAVFAYVSDISDKSSRTIRIGILESMVFLGACGGELLAGVLLENSGFTAAYSVVLGVNVLVICYITLVLKESYSPNADAQINTLVKIHRHVLNVLTVVFKRRPQDKRKCLLLILFGALSVMLIDFGGFNDISLLYAMKKPLHMSPSYIGYFLAEVYFIRGLGVVLGMPVMNKVLNLSDYTIAMIGISFFCIMYVFFGFSTRIWMVFVGAIFGIGGGLPVPCMRSIMSKCVESHEQGSMFAAVACLEVLYTLLASLIFNTLYSKTVSWLPGFSFFLLAGLLVIPMVILLWLYFKTRLETQYQAMGNTTNVNTTSTI